MGTIFDLFNRFVDGVSAGLSETEKTTHPSDTKNYIPKNSYETAIEALAFDARHATWDSYRLDYAKRIFLIIKTNWDKIPDSTKSYAIAQLKDISTKMAWDSYKSDVSKLITKIATGQLN